MSDKDKTAKRSSRFIYAGIAVMVAPTWAIFYFGRMAPEWALVPLAVTLTTALAVGMCLLIAGLSELL